MSTVAPEQSLHPLRRGHALHHDATAAALSVADDERREQLKAERTARARRGLHAVGRLALAALFLISAAAKLADFEATRRAMDTFGVVGSGGLLSFAIASEVTGGLMLALGWHTRRAAIGLVGYLALASLFFHHDLSIDLNRAFALTNAAIAGGLLLLAAHGSGVFSLSGWLKARVAARAR